MRDPFLHLALPEVLRCLGELLSSRRGRRLALALPCEPLDWLLGEAGAPDPAGAWPGFPAELLPLASSGEVHFGLLVHDSALPPCAASWSPWDEEACWLAEDAPAAVAHLLAVGMREARLQASEDPAEADFLEEVDAAAEELARVLGLPWPVSPEVLALLEDGARSARPPEPAVPPGWSFEACGDGIGVLAPAGSFAPQSGVPPAGQPFDLEAELDRAEGLLARGFPASALAVARDALHLVRGEGPFQAAAATMVRSYRALGREDHARRLERAAASWG